MLVKRIKNVECVACNNKYTIYKKEKPSSFICHKCPDRRGEPEVIIEPIYIKEEAKLTVSNTPKPANGEKRELPSAIKRKNFMGPTLLGRPVSYKEISKICEPTIIGSMTFPDGETVHLYEHGSVKYSRY